MKIILIFLVSLCILLSGCARETTTTQQTSSSAQGTQYDKSLSGTFVNENNSKLYIEFKSDGTLYLKESRGHNGKYTIDGNTIIMDFGGQAARGTINGDTFTDKDGDKWIKK